MKKIIFFTTLLYVNFLCFSQTPKDPVGYLVNDDNFINWISNVTNNEWDIQTDIKSQLGERVEGFTKELMTAQTDEEVNSVIADYKFDSEFSDQKMAEHLVFGLYFRQENSWLWELPEAEKMQYIQDAYLKGMGSTDPRWTALHSTLYNKVFTHCGSTGRISASEIAECFWEAIKEAVGIIGGIAAVVSAVNAGNWAATVAAVKKVLKTVARRFGWFGLAIAAIDIGMCIWDAMD